MSAFDKRDRADVREMPDSFKDGRWHYRPLNGERLRYIAHAKGYVMARKTGAMPFVVSEKAWNALPLFERAPPRRANDGIR